MIYLGNLSLKAVQKMEVVQERCTVRHQTPSGGGELLQDLGRKQATIHLEGIFCGENSKKEVEALSQFIYDGRPLNFSAASVPVDQVMVKKLSVSQEKGYQNLYRYHLELEEWQSMKKAGAGAVRSSAAGKIEVGFSVPGLAAMSQAVQQGIGELRSGPEQMIRKLDEKLQKVARTIDKKARDSFNSLLGY